MRFKVLSGRTFFITTLTGFLSFLALLMPTSALALVSGSQILTDPIPNNFGCTGGSYFIVFLNGSTVIAGTSAPTEPADCSSLNGKIWSDVLGNGNDFHAYELNAKPCTARSDEEDWLYCMSGNGSEFLEDQSTFDLQDSYPTPTPEPTPTPTPEPTPEPNVGSGSGGSIFSPETSTSNTGTINIVKTVISDNGGTKVVADFPLFINGVPVVSGETNDFPAPASYTITETSDSDYAQTFSGDCNADGIINLVADDNKFCIITNDDIGAPIVVPPIPPLINVVKVPSPLALPNGPGPVTYTYTLSNIGLVPVTNITMVGDTCNPINLISGDVNGDSKLDVNEVWKYTCTTTLTETHTNTVTVTGWANGISAVDIASATVVVGALVPALPEAGIIPVMKLVPPLIHVTKVPSTLAFLAGGGVVVYTNKVTNPGVAALSNVRLNDDMCSPVKYISGDKDGDSKLDINETWTYTCQANITETTTNTVTAVGSANGFTVKDLAVVTVVVATAIPNDFIPASPRTGLTPYVTSILWILGALLVTIIVLIIFYENRKKRQLR